MGLDNWTILIINLCYNKVCARNGTYKTVIIMFKRVTFVFALLFTNIAMAQEITLEADALPDIASGTPVVQDLSATGTVDNTELIVGSSTELLSPAEIATSSATSTIDLATSTEFGAFSTSSTSTVSTTTVETEESTTENLTPEEEKLFDLVYGGFEHFVLVVLGWE